MSAMSSKVNQWRQDWETMMQHYLPGRDELLAAGLDATEQALGRQPASILDIGGGPGTTAEAVLRRWPDTCVTVLDADPVLSALAEAALPQVTVRQADLNTAAWRSAAGGPHDLVLLVMTLHYLPEQRARRLYAEIRGLLCTGGTLLVADTVPAGPQRQQHAPSPDTWERWWRAVLSDPAMAGPAERRLTALNGMASAEFVAAPAWHEDAAHAAGFATCRTVWRRDNHAVLALHGSAGH
jgi:trans-aconitate methyltransferase